MHYVLLYPFVSIYERYRLSILYKDLSGDAHDSLTIYLFTGKSDSSDYFGHHDIAFDPQIPSCS